MIEHNIHDSERAYVARKPKRRNAFGAAKDAATKAR